MNQAIPITDLLQALAVAERCELLQALAVGEELQQLVNMGAQLAVLPHLAPWLWRIERAGATVDLLTGAVHWPEEVTL